MPSGNPGVSPAHKKEEKKNKNIGDKSDGYCTQEEQWVTAPGVTLGLQKKKSFIVQSTLCRGTGF